MGAAVCIECGPVSACDDDRCCLTCGRDLIVVADAGSVDVLIDAIAEAIAEARAEGEAAGRAAERAAVVAWLRRRLCDGRSAWALVHDIERGEHRNGS